MDLGDSGVKLSPLSYPGVVDESLLCCFLLADRATFDPNKNIYFPFYLTFSPSFVPESTLVLKKATSLELSKWFNALKRVYEMTADK